MTAGGKWDPPPTPCSEIVVDTGAGTGLKYDLLLEKIFLNTPIEIMAKDKIVHRMDLVCE